MKRTLVMLGVGFAAFALTYAATKLWNAHRRSSEGDGLDRGG